MTRERRPPKHFLPPRRPPKQHKYLYHITLTMQADVEIESPSSDPADTEDDARWFAKRNGDVVDSQVTVEVLE